MSIKNWSFSANQVPLDGTTFTKKAASFLIQLVGFLLSKGWTISFCSNGVTTSTTNNLWLTINDIVWYKGSGSTDRSHIVLRSPEGIIPGSDGTSTGEQSKVYIQIDCVNYAENPVSIVYNMFVAEPTGGLVNYPPRLTGQDPQNSGLQIIENNNLIDSSFHFAATPQGHFYALITHPGRGTASTFMAVFPFETINVLKPANKPYPYPFAFITEDNHYNGISIPFLSNNASISGFNHLGRFSSNMFIYHYLLIGIGQQTGDLNGEHVFGPIYVEAANGFVIGKIADFYIRNQTLINNGSVDNLTVPTKAYFGYMSFPVNAILDH